MIVVVNNFTRSRIDTRKIKLKIPNIFKFLKIAQSWHLEVDFVTSLEMSKLHKKFLKKSGPTTVISIEAGDDFPIGEFSGGGEIYLCPQEIKKSGLGLEYFLIHGILHLCGFDHKTKKGEAAMLEKEKQIRAKISQ